MRYTGVDGVTVARVPSATLGFRSGSRLAAGMPLPDPPTLFQAAGGHSRALPFGRRALRTGALPARHAGANQVLAVASASPGSAGRLLQRARGGRLERCPREVVLDRTFSSTSGGRGSESVPMARRRSAATSSGLSLSQSNWSHHGQDDAQFADAIGNYQHFAAATSTERELLRKSVGRRSVRRSARRNHPKRSREAPH